MKIKRIIVVIAIFVLTVTFLNVSAKELDSVSSYTITSDDNTKAITISAVADKANENLTCLMMDVNDIVKAGKDFNSINELRQLYASEEDFTKAIVIANQEKTDKDKKAVFNITLTPKGATNHYALCFSQNGSISLNRIYTYISQDALNTTLSEIQTLSTLDGAKSLITDASNFDALSGVGFLMVEFNKIKSEAEIGKIAEVLFTNKSAEKANLILAVNRAILTAEINECTVPQNGKNLVHKYNEYLKFDLSDTYEYEKLSENGTKQLYEKYINSAYQSYEVSKKAFYDNSILAYINQESFGVLIKTIQTHSKFAEINISALDG
ncbi:MAG: hypothetical protein RSB38_07505, partial [Oscillospiraceae bacterium]